MTPILKPHRKIHILGKLLDLALEVFRFLGSSLASDLACPQDGLGQGWLRLKWPKGKFQSKIEEKRKVLRSLPVVESLSGYQENTFSRFRGPACQHCPERLHSKDRVSTGRPDGHNVCSSLCSIVFGVVFESPF